MGNRTWFMDTIEKGLEQLEEEKKLPGYFSISAIDNIPYINYPGFSKDELSLLRERAKDVMRISRNENKYNEVSITYDKTQNNNGFFKVLGKYGNIDLDDDTLQLLKTSDKKHELVIISIHNHPNDSIFSLNDLLVFTEHPSIKLMEIINRQGEIAFLLRPEPIDLSGTIVRNLFDYIPDLNNRIEDIKTKNPDTTYDLTAITNKEERIKIYNESIRQIISNGVIFSNYVNQKQADELDFSNSIIKNTNTKTNQKPSATEIHNRLLSLESEFGIYMDNGEDGEEWFEKN